MLNCNARLGISASPEYRLISWQVRNNKTTAPLVNTIADSFYTK